MFRPEFLPVLAAMAAASLFCRVGGYMLMRFIPITPRVEAALKGTPLAVMVGIVLPVAMKGNIPELIALAAVALAMRFARDEMVAALIGVFVVAIGRWLIV
ncbi:MAG: AzlD domain-containing protein [Alphaproteobacteria bacterium]|nr:AzlD domain-containing protein [Alphaproteobacteria bacterium]MCA0449793.1 AzlD domain-containing protein [Pseudomonadota bacterium]